MLRLLRGPLLAAAGGGLKASTGIVGLAVEPNARPLLMDLCKQMLGAVRAIPESAQYRVDVEKIAQQRLKVRALPPGGEVVGGRPLFVLALSGGAAQRGGNRGASRV